MISLEEYGVITRLDFASSDAESRALYLRNNSDLVGYFILEIMIILIFI